MEAPFEIGGVLCLGIMLVIVPAIISGGVPYRIGKAGGHMWESFFAPRGVVVIGASHTPTKLGYGAARNLVVSEYPGAIHFVNPKGGELFGRPIYSRIADVPDPVDLAVILIPAAAVKSAPKAPTWRTSASRSPADTASAWSAPTASACSTRTFRSTRPFSRYPVRSPATSPSFLIRGPSAKRSSTGRAARDSGCHVWSASAIS